MPVPCMIKRLPHGLNSQAGSPKLGGTVDLASDNVAYPSSSVELRASTVLNSATQLTGATFEPLD